jgi:hypothetical protein
VAPHSLYGPVGTREAFEGASPTRKENGARQGCPRALPWEPRPSLAAVRCSSARRGEPSVRGQAQDHGAESYGPVGGAPPAHPDAVAAEVRPLVVDNRPKFSRSSASTTGRADSRTRSVSPPGAQQQASGAAGSRNKCSANAACRQRMRPRPPRNVVSANRTNKSERAPVAGERRLSVVPADRGAGTHWPGRHPVSGSAPSSVKATVADTSLSRIRGIYQRTLTHLWTKR